MHHLYFVISGQEGKSAGSDCNIDRSNKLEHILLNDKRIKYVCQLLLCIINFHVPYVIEYKQKCLQRSLVTPYWGGQFVVM